MLNKLFMLTVICAGGMFVGWEPLEWSLDYARARWSELQREGVERQLIKAQQQLDAIRQQRSEAECKAAELERDSALIGHILVNSPLYDGKSPEDRMQGEFVKETSEAMAKALRLEAIALQKDLQSHSQRTAHLRREANRNRARRLVESFQHMRLPELGLFPELIPPDLAVTE